jgi:Flp pilus assembly protein TadB
MLTKDQATAAGESIVGAARERASDARNASAKRVPWYLSFDELRSLEPYQQAHVIAQASRQAMTSRSYWLAYAALVLVVVVIAVVIPREYKGAAWLLLPCILVASFTLRTVFVRRRARELVARPKATSGGDDA